MLITNFPDRKPSVCLICESCPPESRFVDTLKEFDGGPFHPMSGRKYLCEHCVRDYAYFLDVFAEERARMEADYEELLADFRELIEENDALQDVKAAIERISKTLKKKAAAPAKEE